MASRKIRADSAFAGSVASRLIVRAFFGKTAFNARKGLCTAIGRLLFRYRRPSVSFFWNMPFTS